MDKLVRIKILDATYFLMNKFNYRRVNVISLSSDVWLFNPNHQKFPLIRLTDESLATGKNNKINIISQAQQMSKLLNIQADLLNIHFDNVDDELYFEPGYYQALVSDTLISPILDNEFKNFKNAFLAVGADLDLEIKRRELKLLDLRNKPKVRRKFNIKNVQITQILIIVNVIMYLIGAYITYNYSNLFSMIFQGALYKNLVYGANEWWRIFSAAFIHADTFHILINMFALFQTGILVERVYGKYQMLFIYVVGIITSSLLALINSGGSYLTVGASGAIFALIGAILVYLFTSDLYKIRAIRNQIISTLFANLLISLLPGVSFYGHLGGLIGGFLAALIVSNSNKLEKVKTHAIISLVIVVVSMGVYSMFYDNNVHDVDAKMDKHIVSGYYELGLVDHAYKLDANFTEYYQKLGEDY